MLAENIIGNEIEFVINNLTFYGFTVAIQPSQKYVVKVINIKDIKGKEIPTSSICGRLNTIINGVRVRDNKAEYVICPAENITKINKSRELWKEWNNKYHCWHDSVVRVYRCAVCGTLTTDSRSFYKTHNNKYICHPCTTIKGYSTKNNKTIYAPTKKNTRYGFELEGVCRGRNSINEQIANVISLGYDILPTDDCSLPIRGVEFKTPILNSLRGAKIMIDKVNTFVDFSDRRCGQHINISNPKFTDDIRCYIINHHKFLDKLSHEMLSRPEDTRLVCGRCFGDTDYARINYGYECHSNWINLSHSGRAEFRLSKIRTSEQYIALANMWEEIMLVMVDYYNQQKDNDNINSRYGNKLIKIFNKYVEINKNMANS